MTSPRVGHGSEDSGNEESTKVEAADAYAGLQSSLKEVKESLDRLARSVGEVDSKLKSTQDVLKWVLEALSRRSEEKEVMYLKSIQASNELLSSFMTFVNSRVKPLAEEIAVASNEKAPRKETISRESLASPGKKGDEYLVKPSMVKKLQEEEGKEKEKDKRNR
jgi:hypothetical protein